jgi:hypothetical protein
MTMALVTPETLAAPEQRAATPVAPAPATMEHEPPPLAAEPSETDSLVLLGGPDEDALRLELSPRY